MSKDLFDNLVKIGNKNPDLRDNISPILHHLKTSSASFQRKYAYKLYYGFDSIFFEMVNRGIVDISNTPLSIDDLTSSNDLLVNYLSGARDITGTLWDDFRFSIDEVFDEDDFEEMSGSEHVEVGGGPRRDKKREKWRMEYPTTIRVRLHVQCKQSPSDARGPVEKFLVNANGKIPRDKLPEVDVSAAADFLSDIDKMANASDTDLILHRDDMSADEAGDHIPVDLLDTELTDATDASHGVRPYFEKNRFSFSWVHRKLQGKKYKDWNTRGEEFSFTDLIEVELQGEPEPIVDF